MRTLILFCCVAMLPLDASAQRRPTQPPSRRPAARPDTTRGRPRPAQPTPRRPAPPPSEQTFSLDGGFSFADLGFAGGPALGATYRMDRGTGPLVLRAEADFSTFSQNAKLGGVELSSAKLQHFGLSGGVEWLLGQRRSQSRPYLLASAGVYRFDASGPAGDRGKVPNASFASTTDLSASIGAGLRLSRWLSIEGRYLTVGDFYEIPVTISLTLWRGK